MRYSINKITLEIGRKIVKNIFYCGQSKRMVGQVIGLHVANQGLISHISYGPSNTAERNSLVRVQESLGITGNHWA